MPRWFNTAGPCQADIHYVLPPTLRLPGLERLIAQRNYFVIHAPRQVGKTTAMLALAKQLTDSGQYRRHGFGGSRCTLKFRCKSLGTI
jgi:hypothetical protein